MDGVTILNEIVEPITETIPCNMWWVGLIVFGIFVLIGFFIGLAIKDKVFGTVAGSLIGLYFGFMSGYAGCSYEYTIETGDVSIIYEVVADETVSFQDFTTKYEIIEQRGQIYVVKEREPN